MSRASDKYLVPNWEAPGNIKAVVTTRLDGVSQGNYSSFNLGFRTGDSKENVSANREQLVNDWGWTYPPQWLHQVHGIEVVHADGGHLEYEADASWTRTAGLPCVVLTADCLPVIFCDQKGSTVATAHAGWKGLASGVLEATIRSMGVPPGELMAWFGPAISQQYFEVGPEVKEAFVSHLPNAEQAFVPGREDRWMGDLYLLARQRLSAAGVDRIFGGGFCTYADSDRWFSYRRDGGQSGRMATVVWIND